MSEARGSQPGALGDRRLPQVGEVLCGVYRLDRILGWGAVGIVYAAWHLTLGRACAVKLLHPNFVEHTDVRERFRREALSAFKLNHPYIIRIIDFREDESGWPIMVMELLHGESLRQRLGRGPLPLSLTSRLYSQLCDAMAAAHSHGIVHRDIKPENIFLSRVAQPGGADVEVVKVLDFGISKVTDHPEITAMHALLGSPSYMSPEQARGDARTVDPRADIFSLGALLFECLTGRKAFLAADPEMKRQLILSGAVPPLREVAPELPGELDAVLRRACAVDPAARFQSAQELHDALQRALRPALEGGSAAEETRLVSAPPARPAPLPGMTLAAQPERRPSSAAPAPRPQPPLSNEATVMSPGPSPDTVLSAPPLPATVLDAPPLPRAAAPQPAPFQPGGPQRPASAQAPRPSTAQAQAPRPSTAQAQAPSPQRPASAQAQAPSPQRPAAPAALLDPPAAPSGATVLDAQPATVLQAAPLPESPASSHGGPLDGLARLLGGHPKAAEALRRAREALRGREIVLLIPAFFLLVLLIVIVLDMRDQPQLQPLRPAQPRLQIIDGQKSSR